ncbi:hypothetical protein [Dasania marina]|nr:hypothetical protein [Dasania marina]
MNVNATAEITPQLLSLEFEENETINIEVLGVNQLSGEILWQ